MCRDRDCCRGHAGRAVRGLTADTALDTALDSAVDFDTVDLEQTAVSEHELVGKHDYADWLRRARQSVGRRHVRLVGVEQRIDREVRPGERDA